MVSDAEGQARASAAIDASAIQEMERMLKEETKGDYIIQNLLGRGGMAMVYLATEVHLNRKVAIKVLPPELTFGHGVERFKREAKTAAALDHPHIIPVYRVGSGGKLFWYAMKFLEGRSLEDMLKERERMPLAESIEILDQVADALDYAHQHKVVHRDIKPANVMLDSRNRVIVTDFGIAKAMTEGGLTASGSVIGTPYFMSPEQGMGKPVSGASDQYSVAVMAYRMLSGHVPFEGDSAIDILHKHCMTPPPPLDVVSAGLPPHVAWAVHKALEKDAANRFPSVTAFVKALKNPTPEAAISTAATMLSGPAVKVSPESIAKAATRTGSTGPGRPSMSRMSTQIMSPAAAGARAKPESKPRGKGLLVGGAAGGLLIVGVGGWLVFGRNGGTEPATSRPNDSAPPAAAAAAPAAPALARVVIDKLPANGTITVDGRAQAGPAFDVAPGQHEVRLQAPGYETQVVPVTAAAGETQRIFFGARQLARNPAPANQPPPTRQPAQAQSAPRPAPPAAAAPSVLLIRVNPWANILVDGVEHKEKTGLVDTVSAGPHAIRLERADHTTIDTVVTVRAGEQLRLSFRLSPRSAP